MQRVQRPAEAAPPAGAPAATPSVDGGRVPRPPAAFTGTASADGVRVGLAIPRFLIVENFVDGGGPSAQASLDSLGTSKSFASLPYPGETGVALPGLVGTLTGKSIPSYPFFVASSSPATPDSAADQPGYRLASHSDASASTASAQVGETTTSKVEGGAFSTASVTTAADGTVVSESSTRADVSLGPLRLSGLESKARVELRPDGKVVRTSSMKVHELSLAGVTIGVTDRGLVVGDLAIPLGDVLGRVGRMLSPDGTTVQFLPASETPDSILSAGLLVRTSQVLPVVGRPAEVGITIGRAFAMGSATASAVPAEPVVPDGSAGPAGAVGNGSPGATAPAPVLGDVASGLAPPPPAGPEVVPAPSARPQALRRLPRSATASALTLFPIVALAAVVLLLASFGSSAGTRARRKERWAWSS